MKGAPKAVKRRPKKPAHAGTKIASLLHTLLCAIGRGNVWWSVHKTALQRHCLLCTSQVPHTASLMGTCLQQLQQGRRGETIQLAARSGAVGARPTTAVTMRGQKDTRKVQSPVYFWQLPTYTHIQAYCIHPCHCSHSFAQQGDHSQLVMLYRWLSPCARRGCVQEWQVQGHQKAGLGPFLHSVAG